MKDRIYIRNTFQTEKQYELFFDDIRAYTLYAQKSLRVSLIILFGLYALLSVLIYNVSNKPVSFGLWICCFEILFSSAMVSIFKSKFIKKSFVIPLAYLNVFQLIAILDIQYLMYPDFVSNTILVCIVMCTALSVVGKPYVFGFLVSIVFIADSIITVCVYINKATAFYLLTYLIDNIVIVLFAVTINRFLTYIKLKEFKMKRDLRRLSEIDTLTHLFNRYGVETYIEKHFNENDLCAFIMIDVDNFKLINDTLGHQKGDEALIKVSSIIKSSYHSKDCISRFGGDEFLVFCPQIKDKSSVINATEKLLENFPFYISNDIKNIKVTCSVGIGFSYGINENLYSNLYRNADKALYKAKALGKNVMYVFETPS